MKLEADPAAMERCSTELMEVSRSVRKVRLRLEETDRRMRQLSSLQGLRHTMCAQEENLHVISGRLVNLSSTLREVSDLYFRTEEHSTEELDERAAVKYEMELRPADAAVTRLVHQLLA